MIDDDNTTGENKIKSKNGLILWIYILPSPADECRFMMKKKRKTDSVQVER